MYRYSWKRSYSHTYDLIPNQSSSSICKTVVHVNTQVHVVLQYFRPTPTNHFAPQLIQLKMTIFTDLFYSFFFVVLSDLNLEELLVKGSRGVTQTTVINPLRLVTFPYARMMLRNRASSQFLFSMNHLLLVSATYMVLWKVREYLNVAVDGYLYTIIV